MSAAVYHLSGAVTMISAADLREEGRRQLAAGVGIFDFSGVTGADSAALALILDWLRLARSEGRQLLLRALPDSVSSLARLYGLDTLLAGHEG